VLTTAKYTSKSLKLWKLESGLQLFLGGAAERCSLLANNALKCTHGRCFKLCASILTSSRRQCWDTGDAWNPDTDATLDIFMDACSHSGLKAPSTFSCTSFVLPLKFCCRYPFTSSPIQAGANCLSVTISCTSSIDLVNTKRCIDVLLRTPGRLFTFTTGIC
jgi:hypothetical protein